MKARKLFAIVVVALLAIPVLAIGAGKELVETRMLIRETREPDSQDSSAYVSPWIPVRVANRIAIQVYSE